MNGVDWVIWTWFMILSGLCRSLKLSPQCPCVCMFQTEELNQQMVSSLEQLQSCWAEITELKCMVKCPGDRAAGPAQHGEPDAGLGLLLDQA